MGRAGLCCPVPSTLFAAPSAGATFPPVANGHVFLNANSQGSCGTLRHHVASHDPCLLWPPQCEPAFFRPGACSKSPVTLSQTLGPQSTEACWEGVGSGSLCCPGAVSHLQSSPSQGLCLLPPTLPHLLACWALSLEGLCVGLPAVLTKSQRSGALNSCPCPLVLG